MSHLKPSLLFSATHTIGLFAGDMELHASVVPDIHASIRLNPPAPFLIKDIAARYADLFAKYRRNEAERKLLTPLNLTIDQFIARQSEMSQDVAIDISSKLLTYQINSEAISEAIIAGIDITGGHIYKVIDPGLSVCFDIPFFAASGIGRPHAESQFMLAGFEKQWSLAKTIFLVYTAKTRAEATAGVGKQTDLMIIGPWGIYSLTPEELEMLRLLLKNKNEKEEKTLNGGYECRSRNTWRRVRKTIATIPQSKCIGARKFAYLTFGLGLDTRLGFGGWPVRRAAPSAVSKSQDKATTFLSDALSKEPWVVVWIASSQRRLSPILPLTKWQLYTSIGNPLKALIARLVRSLSVALR